MKTSLTPSNKLQRAPDSAAPSPAARPGPSVANRVSTAFAGFSGLRARGSTGQDGNMAPRSSISLRSQPSATQAFSSAGHHAQKALQDLSRGLRHEAKQQTNDFKAFISETKSNHGTAEMQRMKQTYHQKVAQSAYASSASHARSFFGAAAQGITQSVRQAASAVTSMVVNFDPHQLAQKSARYGDAALAKASQLAKSALQLVEATAQSAVNGAQKAFQSATNGNGSVMDRVEDALGSAAQRMGNALQSAMQRAEKAVDSAIRPPPTTAERVEQTIDNAVQQLGNAAKSAAQRIDKLMGN